MIRRFLFYFADAVIVALVLLAAAGFTTGLAVLIMYLVCWITRISINDTGCALCLGFGLILGLLCGVGLVIDFHDQGYIGNYKKRHGRSRW